MTAPHNPRIALGELETTVLRVAEPPLLALGLEVVHVEIESARGGRIVRFFLDLPGAVATSTEGARITVDDLTRATRELDVLFDVEDVVPGSWTLEVSSPGLDRPLGRRADFEAHLGQEARLETTAPVGGRKRWTGRLLDLEGDAVGIEVDGVRHAVPITELRKAHLKFDYSSLAGGAKKPSAQRAGHA